MPRRATDDGLRYMRWLEGMWETHKLDLYYPNAGREEERKEEILRMLRVRYARSRLPVGTASFYDILRTWETDLLISSS
jgi:hypothetical protein